MPDTRFAQRSVLILILVNALFFSALCGVAKQTGLFHLRVTCEGFAAAYLVLLTVFVCLAKSGFHFRLLAALIGLVAVVFACRYVLGAGFASWVESAIWYAPVTAALCIPLRVSGHTIHRQQGSHQAKTFSILALMAMTAVVALLFPSVRLLEKTRAGGQLDQILWFTDPLVLVAPISAIGVGLVWAMLVNKPFHAGIMLVAAPILGLLTCKIYGWNHHQSVVIPTTAAACLIAAISWTVGRIGFAIAKRAQPASPNQ